MLVIQDSDCSIKQSPVLNSPAHFAAAFMSKLKNRSKRKRNVVGAYKILYALTFNTPVNICHLLPSIHITVRINTPRLTTVMGHGCPTVVCLRRI